MAKYCEKNLTIYQNTESIANTKDMNEKKKPANKFRSARNQIFILNPSSPLLYREQTKIYIIIIKQNICAQNITRAHSEKI